MSADDDVMNAIVAKWKANATLAADVPAGPKGGDIPAPVPVPYCWLEVMKHKDPEYSTGGVYVDWRRVRIVIYALKAAANTILGHVATVFEGACPGTAKVLAVPNATHMSTLPVEPGHLEKSAERKDGEEIWKGIAEYVVMTQRAVP